MKMAIEHILTVPVDPLETTLRDFCDQVRQLPGVVSIVRHADGNSLSADVTVVVDDIFTNATRNVFHLYHNMNAAAQGARFELDVKDARTVLDVTS
jgi:hypothetical protein